MLHDTHIGHIFDLVTTINNNHSDFTIAALAHQIICPNQNLSDCTVSQIKDTIRLAGRIYELMPGCDEPRFSLYDYADAITNARKPVSTQKLLALEDDVFIAVMIWLATDKRETYEDKDHVQISIRSIL